MSDALKLSLSLLALMAIVVALVIAGYVKAGMNLSAVIDHLG
ncbi:MAG: hypothetical protein ACPHAS_08160 [Synechococcus sp.]